MPVKSVVIAVVIAALPGAALAQSADTVSTPRIDQRQAEQQRRIERGVQSGQLTPTEAARLERGQQQVQKMENRAMADGQMTPQERMRIEHAQDQQSRRIHRERHDRQTAHNLPRGQEHPGRHRGGK